MKLKISLRFWSHYKYKHLQLTGHRHEIENLMQKNDSKSFYFFHWKCAKQIEPFGEYIKFFTREYINLKKMKRAGRLQKSVMNKLHLCIQI